MKVTQPRNQFDRPESIATPATPSCCCCCCCCVATVVSTTAVGAMTANRQAKIFSRPSLLPTMLALLAVPLGLAAAALAGNEFRDVVPAIAAGSLVAVLLWFSAFHLAASKGPGPPAWRSLRYLIFFAVCFALEFVVGFALVVVRADLYGAPYVFFAVVAIFFTLSEHRASLPLVPPIDEQG